MGRSLIFAVTNDIRPDRRMIRHCTTLQRSGYDVTLVGRILPTSATLPSFSFRTHRIKCIFQKGPFFYAEFNWRLRKYLKKQRPDIIGAVDYDTLKGAAGAAKALGCKLIFDAHEWYEEVPELEGRKKIKKTWLKIASMNMPYTHLRYTVSKGLAKALTDNFKLDFKVIHNYPEEQVDEPSAVRDDILVYLGVLNRGRGLEEMIMAMNKIEAKLWIIGDGDIKDSLWQLAEKEGLLHKVIFKGFVPPEDLEPLLRQARIGINLLDGKSNSYRHSLANKFFDYLHAGLPQLCMDFPEYKKYNKVHRVAALVGDLKETSIVYAINHLLNDRNYWFTFHTSCLEARQEWNWQNEAPRLLAYVDAV